MIRAALAAAAARLAGDTPRLDAELLMAHALAIPRETLLMRHLDDPVPAGFAALLDRRIAHEPVAYITGGRAFWTIDLVVGPGVLVPRADTETLLEAAVAHFAGTPGPARILDLGTGSGALLLAALDEWREARGVGIDRSPEALAVAADNAARLGLADRARIMTGGWAGTGERFDLILCNPPYIAADAVLPPEVARYEPPSALFAGADGLDDYRVIAPLLPAQIAPGGMAAIEVGAGQAADVAALLFAQGLDTAVAHDLAGRARCVIARPGAEERGRRSMTG
ncbi:MAG: peptide chain release factor N(5)-glutamine methyltransferase [Sphingomonas sp.]